MAILWPSARDYLEAHHQAWLTDMKTYSGYHIYEQVANLEQDDMRRLVLVEPGRVLSLYATEDLPPTRVLLLEFYC
jgi:hypothetical protein